ncbi:DUF2651 family protein [Niallia sp. Krafla_26]|uniref:DUF2651 family protein n=1 Tax=Niallia sp. Krafla_26 TaxID=3064703 RepID=UPI003D1819E2
MFGILIIAFFIQGLVQGGVYNLYGESLTFGLFIYPAIVLGVSIYGTKKTEKWFVMPIITLIILPPFFEIVTYDDSILFLIYLILSIIGSIGTRLSDKRIQ